MTSPSHDSAGATQEYLAFVACPECEDGDIYFAVLTNGSVCCKAKGHVLGKMASHDRASTGSDDARASAEAGASRGEGQVADTPSTGRTDSGSGAVPPASSSSSALGCTCEGGSTDIMCPIHGVQVESSKDALLRRARDVLHEVDGSNNVTNWASVKDLLTDLNAALDDKAPGLLVGDHPAPAGGRTVELARVSPPCIECGAEDHAAVSHDDASAEPRPEKCQSELRVGGRVYRCEFSGPHEKHTQFACDWTDEAAALSESADSARPGPWDMPKPADIEDALGHAVTLLQRFRSDFTRAEDNNFMLIRMVWDKVHDAVAAADGTTATGEEQ